MRKMFRSDNFFIFAFLIHDNRFSALWTIKFELSGFRNTVVRYHKTGFAVSARDVHSNLSKKGALAIIFMIKFKAFNIRNLLSSGGFDLVQHLGQA